MLLMFSVDAPPFASVTTFCPPTPPTATETQFRLAGLTEALPEVDEPPVPVNATVCGLPVPESVKLSVALRAPDAAGLKITEAEQLADAATLVPQVLLEMLKSPASVPPIATLLSVTEELVPFVSVVDFAALLDPTVMLPNAKDVGLAETVPEAAVPSPVKAIVWGVLLAESAKLRVAASFPVVFGAKTIFAVQLALAARVDPQVLL